MDLNREVAEKVMEWEWCKYPAAYWKPEEEKFIQAGDWNPLKDLNQCFGVVEKLKAKFKYIEITVSTEGHQCFLSLGSNGWDYAGESNKSVNEAILKAALAAFDWEHRRC